MITVKGAYRGHSPPPNDIKNASFFTGNTRPMLCKTKRNESGATYEYSNREIGAKRKDGHVKLERSPVNDASVFKNEEKLPCWSAGILSRAEVSAVVIVRIEAKRA